MPIVTQSLLDIYGWRGALLILSGLAFHSVPFGAFLSSYNQSKEHNKDVYQQLFGSNHSLTSTQRNFRKLSLPNKSTSNHRSCFGSLLESRLRHIGDVFGVSLLKKFAYIVEVFVPGFVWGFTIISWMIYVVSMAVSKGLTNRQGSIIASSSGVGMVFIRLVIPLLHTSMTYKQLLYTSSVVTAISLSMTTLFDSYVALNIISLFIGLGIGCLGGELYISARMNSEDSEHYHAIAWLHVAYGTGSILCGVITGKYNAGRGVGEEVEASAKQIYGQRHFA